MAILRLYLSFFSTSMHTLLPKMALEVKSLAFWENGCFFSGQSIFAKRTLTIVESWVRSLKVSPSIMPTTFPVRVWLLVFRERRNKINNERKFLLFNIFFFYKTILVCFWYEVSHRCHLYGNNLLLVPCHSSLYFV